jgi:hypothetical protein
MATLDTKPYLKYILHASLRQHAPREDITYAVISEFISEHKSPPDRFVIYPQISLRWKPDNPRDTRSEVPDFGLGNFTLQEPYFILRVGAEAKRSVDDVMGDLPDPSAIQDDPNVMAAFHALFYQGEDQAKAAIKGMQTFLNTIPFLLFVGPYWASVQYGPFTPAQLSVRTHKPSDSSDFKEAVKAARRLSEMPTQRHIYLLGTTESSRELERIISSTDAVANSLRFEANNYHCKLLCCCSLLELMYVTRQDNRW